MRFLPNAFSHQVNKQETSPEGELYDTSSSQKCHCPKRVHVRKTRWGPHGLPSFGADQTRSCHTFPLQGSADHPSLKTRDGRERRALRFKERVSATSAKVSPNELLRKEQMAHKPDVLGGCEKQAKSPSTPGLSGFYRKILMFLSTLHVFGQ